MFILDCFLTKMSKQEFSDFYRACRKGDVSAVKKILPTLTVEEIEKIEPNGSTALHAASYHGHIEIVKLVLSRSPNIAIRNKYGNTAGEEASDAEIKALFVSFFRFFLKTIIEGFEKRQFT